VPSIICPICRGLLAREPRRWFCAQGHSYDVAREGYVNLLPPQHRNSREPGDTAESLKARRAFLEAGHYGPLRDALVRQAASQSPLTTVLDVGCGEGWYTSALAGVAQEVIGLDIAKPAIQLAARRHPGPTWIVGSGALLPVSDASVDLAVSAFSHLHVAELCRVLRAGGHLLVATPAPDHLYALRERLFEEVRQHQPDKFLTGLEAGFELRERIEIRVPLTLDNAALRQLVLMTPYAWKAKPERRAAVEALHALETQAAFALLCLRRKAAE
jgi:23S rRNA (guanine745-N1)-methyltransferase